MTKKPLILIIMDGWGINPKKRGNAIRLAKTPNFDSYLKRYPHSRLKASGEAVGLPKGFQGNSEVGHLNIGAGRVVDQALMRINRSIKKGSFFKNKEFLKAINNCKKHNSCLHLMGLIQDQGVHAHQDHLISLLKIAKKHDIKKVCVHAFTDGRDTLPKSTMRYLDHVQRQMKKLKVGKFCSLIGRYYAMDRDNRWKRTNIAYNALIHAKGDAVKDYKEGIKLAYKKKQTDEFIKPKIIKGYEGIKDNDSIIFFNYRLDRARQLTHAFTDKKFNRFKRKDLKTVFIPITEYYKGLKNSAFKPISMKNLLGPTLSKKGLRQLRIAETEKYAHVTFFFNGEVERPYPKEDRIIIPSPKVATYDLKPKMSAYKVADNVVKAVDKDKYDVIILNFANGDMVGHTNLKAAIKACEAVDECTGKVVKKILSKKGIALVTADHGNAEVMIDYKTGKTHTAHTTNPVNFIYISDNTKNIKTKNGRLADLSPTILKILKIKKPKEMTGRSLI